MLKELIERERRSSVPASCWSACARANQWQVPFSLA